MDFVVLFVDDEPSVLAGLRRMLRPGHRDWEMHFVESGQQALEILEQHPCQVIVSDMRMPGMDGVQLLSTVSERYPHMVRIVLSGQSEREQMLRSVGLMHQYLAKPCEPATLVGTIEGALKLRNMLADARLRSLVTRTRALPSLPSAYLAITEELNSAEPSMDRIVEIVSRDVAMVAKTLQMANSAYFGGSSRVSGTKQAIMRLGLEIIKVLVLLMHVFEAFRIPPQLNLGIEKLWQHSFVVSWLAKQIARAEGAKPETVEATSTAGLLHDLGKLILAANMPTEYAAVLAEARGQAITVEDAEQKEFGVTHAEAGAYLARLWGLPDELVSAMAYHHNPGQAPDRGFSAAVTVHASDALVSEDQTGEGRAAAPKLDIECLERLDLASHLPAWRALRDRITEES